LRETSIRDDSCGIAPVATPAARIVTTNDASDDLIGERALEVDGTVLVVEVNSDIETGDRRQAADVTIANIVVRARTAVSRSWSVGANSEFITTTVVPLTLILVNATLVTITIIASWAIRADAALTVSVLALGQRITATVGRRIALVNIDTLGVAGTSVEWRAVRACVAASVVGADGKRITRAGVRITLINIDTAIFTIADVALGWAVAAGA